ncbi:MAG: type II toxin-antitoxin system PemK/MazF family toxin [Candidatus Electrothrix communis]|nr:MAG: type II toxin-antitoxin system PemK/MazF family toxin [Candidatus Electrothrix communis]
MTYKRFDVVTVPFPFTDRQSEKRRPALVLSDSERFNAPTEHCVLAMITSAKNPDWPLDVPIGSLQKAGLPAPSKVRMKIFTLDSRLIMRKTGALSGKDQKGVQESLQQLLGVVTPS